MKKRLENNMSDPLEEMDLINNSVYYSQIKADENFWKTSRNIGLFSAAVMTGIYLISHPEYIEAIRNYIKF